MSKTLVLDWIEGELFKEAQAIESLQAFGKLLRMAAKNRGEESFPSKKAITDIIHTLTQHAKTCSDDTIRTFLANRSTLEGRNPEDMSNTWEGEA